MWAGRWVLALLVLGGCSVGGHADDPSTTTSTLEPFRVLALGDSYTIGEGVPEADRWPEQLATRLVADGYRIAPVEVVARTGWTTADLDRGIDAASVLGPYDLVTLQIGVNDQFQGLSVDGYRQRLTALVDRAVSLASDDPGRVVVISIPDWGATPFGGTRDRDRIADEIDAFNEVAFDVADAAAVLWVDVTRISRRDDPSLVAPDGLHPSGQQYRLWVDAILPTVLRALG